MAQVVGKPLHWVAADAPDVGSDDETAALARGASRNHRRKDVGETHDDANCDGVICRWDSGSDGSVGGGLRHCSRCCEAICGSRARNGVPCQDRVRHVLLSLRLRKAYVAYSIICCALSCLACGSSFARVAKRTAWEGEAWSSHEWEPWERALEVIISIVVCSETLSTLWLTGWKDFIRDCWCIFDATVMALTLLTWCLLALRRALLVGESVLKLDLPLLALRFFLQPCRVLAMASMARRGRRMQQNTIDIALDSWGCPGKAEASGGDGAADANSQTDPEGRGVGGSAGCPADS